MANRKGEQKKAVAATAKAANSIVKKVGIAERMTNEESLALFDNPWKNDRERIRLNTAKYASKTLSEAFADEYDTKINVSSAVVLPIAKIEIGDTIKLNVLNVSKGSVELDNTNLKCEVQFAVDLSRFPKFGEGAKYPMEVAVKVVDKKRNTIVVNPLAGAYDEFISQYENDNAIKTQYSMDNIKTVTIKNLQNTRGGFAGDLIVPELSDLTGKTMTVKAFIPGSQIVANIEKDFNKWVGQDVDAFVTNVVPQKNLKSSADISIICSRKSLLRHYGNINIVNVFKSWTEDGTVWKNNISRRLFSGIVTGVINSSKKRGVFVEIPELNITTLVEEEVDKLVNYKPGTDVLLQWTGFEEPMKETDMGKQHDDPYKIEDNILLECKVRPIFKFSAETTEK